MMLFEVVFGKIPSGRAWEEAEELVGSYLASMLHGGRVCGEYRVILQKGLVRGYVNLAGAKAMLGRNHTGWGRKELAKVKAFFGKEPQWNVLEDAAPKREVTWRGAPFLYLFTHLFDRDAVVCRGDNGMPVPVYNIAVTDQSRENLYAWQCDYRDHDAIWIGSGKLETAAYKQLAEYGSELSLSGRELCKEIEKATGVPTYYFIMRYYGHKNGEEKRKCPACGRQWRTREPADSQGKFWRFAFKCERCRIVSQMADCVDERRARIGD